MSTPTPNTPSPATSTLLHKKRPHHPSPLSSYRSTGAERGGVSKRARWDVSAPMPSPPVISVPLPAASPKTPFALATSPLDFNFGFGQKAKKLGGSRLTRQRPYPTSLRRDPGSGARIASSGTDAEDMDDGIAPTVDYRIHSAAALERLQRNAYAEGEIFVDKMRQWEGSQSTSLRVPDENYIAAEAGSTSTSASSLSMSNSVTSSSTLSSVSGSEAGASGRKRSWSIVEDEDEDEEDCELGLATTDMEWEVVAQKPSAAARLGTFVDPSPSRTTEDDQSSQVPENSDDQDGDDEQEDGDDEDSDDELVFVFNNPAAMTANEGDRAPRSCFPTVTPANAESMLAELSQVLAAGAGSLDDFGIGSVDTPKTLPDGGALWQ